MDHGFWTPEDRAHWRSVATEGGAIPVVVYLGASHQELWSRVSKRNARQEDDPNSIYFAESDLIRYRSRFVAPEPGEPHIDYNGDPESVLKTLQSERARP
ncbi:hypothetical protein AB0O67_26270 [Streptomyces sp. NPDC086077]|uniref:AAA family ATPase n=1 Tax=Streptomyces sp. NPDC086077 TaxID=3154862 RepID=UPI00343F7091